MTASQMSIEADERQQRAVRRLLETERGSLDAAAKKLLADAFPGPLTHGGARLFGPRDGPRSKYACEIMLGAPSPRSVPPWHRSMMRPAGIVRRRAPDGFAVGRQSDIVALQAAANTRRRKGTSPSSTWPTAHWHGPQDLVVSIQAGEEKSVAATKSYIASCAALFAIVAGANRKRRA